MSESILPFRPLERWGISPKFVLFPDEGHLVLKPADSELWDRTISGWLARYRKASDERQEGR